MASMPETSSAPVLSTPDSHLFDRSEQDELDIPRRHLSAEQLAITYEIERTVSEIRSGKWKRIALQFPDHMLPDAPWVSKALSRGLRHAGPVQGESVPRDVLGTTETLKKMSMQGNSSVEDEKVSPKIFILADTSYGACCVDEVAAEHADADVVVHYGRSCLSPTARLAALYVFTNPPLDLDRVCQRFAETYPDKASKIMLTADIPYMSRMHALGGLLQDIGYSNIFVTELVHDTSSPVPNRTVPQEARQEVEALKAWDMFHVSEPPEALLLTLSSRVGRLRVLPTSPGGDLPQAQEASSMRALRRRYATLIKLATVPVFGILINTLSVKNYMGILTHVKKQIAEAGKKSYTFVVGKVNAAKVANFSEVGGWVVIGCWESSLLESRDFWKPVITPFELEVALTGDSERIWTGAWSSDFQEILRRSEAQVETAASSNCADGQQEEGIASGSEEESAPPEFDLRTGKYVSRSRPMRGTSKTVAKQADEELSTSQSLAKRAARDVATIGGLVSPAADFFKNNRAWQGLGSDYEVVYEEDGSLKAAEGAQMEEGRKGIAKGYTVSSNVEGQ